MAKQCQNCGSKETELGSVPSEKDVTTGRTLLRFSVIPMSVLPVVLFFVPCERLIEPRFELHETLILAFLAIATVVMIVLGLHLKKSRMRVCCCKVCGHIQPPEYG